MRGSHYKLLVDPARTAHVVIDLQVGFMCEDSLPEVPVARAVVENVNRISQDLCSAGGTIAYAKYNKYDPEEPHRWVSHYNRMTPDALKQI